MYVIPAIAQALVVVAVGIGFAITTFAGCIPATPDFCPAFYSFGGKRGWAMSRRGDIREAGGANEEIGGSCGRHDGS